MRTKRSTVLCLMLLVSAVAMAIPAKPGLTRNIQLSDGTTISARLVGDEHGHFWLGNDGKTYIVGSEGIATAVDSETIKSKASVRRQQSNARRAKRLAPRKVGDVGSITGQKKGLIILVNFSNVSFKSADNNALYQRIANEANFSYGSFKGSMYDYFYAQSDGQFQLTFDVVGPYTVSNTQAYYGGNDSDGNDEHPAAMVIEALQQANSDVDFSDYDWDEDGEVEQVYVVYAGKGEADGGDDDTIWPHEWTLSSAAYYGDGAGAQTMDGVRINTYACGGELNGDGNIAGIGTMCHEFSHCLGYPDFYDTDYSGGHGMGYWDLMDGGSYNGDGYRPAAFTSYERWVAGWRTPVELTATTQVNNMPAYANTSAPSYIIYNPGNSNEYFLLENRQQTGWDTDVPGEGLLILHVDYDASAWSSNTPNDTPSHQRMTWIAADNNYQYTTYQGTKYYTFDGMANDPFPYGSVNSFSAATTPAASLYNTNTNTNTKYLDSSIENITQNSNGTVSFLFRGVSNVATPTFSPAAGRYETAQTVTISCETSGAVIYYTLDGTTPTTSSTVYSSPLTISETTTVKAMAFADNEESAIATAKYRIGASTSDPNTTTFTRVASVNDLEPGMRYIIACGSKATAAGALNSTYLGQESVTVSGDVITIGSGVAVFVLEETSDGWSFQNESTDEYLYATAAKSVKYSSTENSWTLEDGTDGVIMTYGDYGTMLYNVSSPRFTTYTSSPSASMIQANLYMEDSSVTPTIPDPVIVADETLSFSTPVGTPQTNTFEVLTENLTENVTLTLSDQNNVFTLGQSTIASTETDTNVSVTFTPTQAGTYTATVTLSSAGAQSVTVTLTGTATEPMNPDDAYTVAEVLDMFANSNVPTDSVYVKGIVSQIKSLDTTQYTRAQYYISDDGTTTDQFYVYNGYYLNKTDFTSDDQLAVGDTVVVYGLLTTFNSTNEFAANNYLVYLQRPAPKLDVTLTFSAATASATLGENFTAPTLTINPAGLSVTYSSSKVNVATVNASTGVVTLVGGGTTVITATFEGDDNYNPAEVSYTLTVVDPSNTNSQDNPYTVGEVQDMFANNTVPSMAVYVKGIVSEITSLDVSKYTNARYYISDDGTTTDQFYVYNGKYLGNTDFTSNDQLAVGDTVIVYGELITYTNSTTTTNEFAAGNYIVYLQRPTPKQDVTLTFSSTSVTAIVGETFTAPTLTTTPSGISVTYSSNNISVATVDSQTGAVTIVAAGTAVITASFTGDDTYNSATASYTINAREQGDTSNQFQLVNSTSELVSGMRYIIACGSQATAAGCLSNNLLTPVDVTVENNTITATDDVTVFILTGNQTNGWNFQNESTNEYLYATAAKSLAYGTDAAIWTLANGTNGVEMTFGGFGTMTYNVGSPRFTTYTSSASTSMIRANLYADVSGNVKQESTLTFSETSVTATMGESFTAPTLTTTPTGISVTYSSSNTSVATVDSQTGAVTLVAAGTTVITASFAGNDNFLSSTASYTLTVYKAQQSGADKYELVTDASTLAANDEILIAYVKSSDNIVLALSTTQNDNNRSATNDLTLNQDGTLTPGDEVQVITLEQSGDSILFNVGNSYLYAASSSKNWLRTEATADKNAKALITISNGEATITFQGSYTRNTMRYNPNNGTPIFSCYATTSTTGSLPLIYRKVVTPVTPVVAGDIDNDGEIGWSDVPALARVLAGHTASPTGQPYNLDAADYDGNGQRTLKDLTKLINHLLGY